MNIVVDRAKLNSEIAFVSPACRHPQAGFLLLTAADNQLVLSTHNGSSATSTIIQATVNEPGEFCVPGWTLPHVVMSLDRGTSEVRLAVADSKLDLSWKDFKASFQPMLRKGDIAILTDTSSECDATHLRRAIEMVVGVAGPSHDVLIGADDTGVLAAATDGRRLTEVIFGVKPAETFVVGSKLVSDIRLALLKGKTATIRRGKHLSIECGGRTIGMPLSALTFPAYEQIFTTKEPQHSISADVKALLGAVTRVTTLNDSDTAVTFGTTSTDLWIADRGDSAREAVARIDANPEAALESMSANTKVPSVTLNGSFVVDALRSMAVEQCELLIASATEQVILRPLQQVEYSFRSAIMPIRK